MLHICMYIYNMYVIKVVRLKYFRSTQNRMFLSCVEVLWHKINQSTASPVLKLLKTHLLDYDQVKLYESILL